MPTLSRRHLIAAGAALRKIVCMACVECGAGASGMRCTACTGCARCGGAIAPEAGIRLSKTGGGRGEENIVPRPLPPAGS